MPVVDALSFTLSTVRARRDQAATVASAAHPAADQRQASLQFSLGREPHLPKLQRGIYVIALPNPQSGALPKWREYQLTGADPKNVAAKTELYRRDRLFQEQGHVDFAYVKLAVDYAEPTSAPQV